VAGSGAAGSANGWGTAAQLTQANGVYMDPAVGGGGGAIFISDYGTHTVRVLNASGYLGSAAGLGVLASGFLDAANASARFYWPRGGAVTPMGVIVADSGNNRLRLITSSLNGTTTNGIASVSLNAAGVLLGSRTSTLGGNGSATNANGLLSSATFGAPMPDFNMRNPEVVKYHEESLKFWLDRGIDGFRLDAVTSFFTGNANKNIEFLSWLGDAAKSIKADSFIVAEGPWSMTSSGLLQYYPARIDSFFNFPVSVTGNRIVDRVRLQQGYDLARVTALFNQNLDAIRPDAMDTPFLSNHDQSRVAGILFVENNDLNHKLLASIYLLMPGKPFMYYGEEIGMRGSGRDENKRLPLIWSEADKTGETNPASAADYNMTLQVTKGVDDLMAIPDSLWNHYKKVISVRNKYNDFIETARLTATNIDPRLYTLTYATDAGELTIITNITATTIAVGNSEGWTLLEGIYPTLEKGSVTASDLTIPPFTTFILG
jgi:hypothetical protein